VEAVNATRRVLALILAGGLFIAFDIVGVARTGVLGLLLVILVLATRVYVTLAQGALATCRVRGSYRGYVEGRDVDVEYELCNSSPIPVAVVELSLGYPQYLKLSKGSRGGLLAIPPRGCVEYRVSFTGRVGLHRIGPIRAVLRDPLGLYRGVELSLGPVLEVRVKPFWSERMLRSIFQASRVSGVSRSRRAGEGVEFYTVRDYRPGDELRRVYWKALARGRLAVKEFESESSTYALFILALDERMLHGPYLETPLEHASRILASIAEYASRRGDYIAALIVGPGLLAKTEFRRGRRGYVNMVKLISSIDYENHILKVNPEVRAMVSDTARMAKYVKTMCPRERVNVIAITSTSEITVNVIKNLSTLRGLGFSINALILVPQLYGLHRLKPFERAVYRLKVHDDIRKVHFHLKELRSRGVNAIMVTPWETPSKVIARIYGL
jgi:uncharacterized protein (DUF58 family)